MKSLLESIIGKKSGTIDPFKVIENTWGDPDKYARLIRAIEEAKKVGRGRDVKDDQKWLDLFTYIVQNNHAILSKEFSDAFVSYFEEAPFEGDFGGSEIFAKDFKKSNWKALVEDIMLYIEDYK